MKFVLRCEFGDDDVSRKRDFCQEGRLSIFLAYKVQRRLFHFSTIVTTHSVELPSRHHG